MIYLGGKDPYSASKASAELIIQSYLDCYFRKNLKIKFQLLEQAMLLEVEIGQKID